MAEYFGRYEGPVKAEFLDDGRKMRLLAAFIYIDPEEVKWEAPAGSVIDGASIPRIAWSIIGGPFEGKYRDASVIHDVACDQKVRSWESVHKAFYNSMRTSGVGIIKAKVMYGAVYHFGPRWSLSFTIVVLRDQAEAAISKVKASLDPQSQVQANVSIKSRNFLAILKNQPEKANVNINVVPSERRLHESDFAKLEKAITEKGLTLQDIRNYNPFTN